MSKKKKRQKQSYGMNRQELQAREADRELKEAQDGMIDENNHEIAERVNEEYETELRYIKESSRVIELIDDTPVNTGKMSNERWYVVDTNLIISCVDILYDADDETWREPINFKPSLNNAHIIIPQVVFNELDHMKSEATQRGMTARTAFSRLKKFFPNSGRSIEEIMNLAHPIPTGWKKQTISILPLHRNFSKCLPYVPEKEDNDGWIALTALAATMIHEGLPIDGTAGDILSRDNSKKDVVLLTNDKSLLSKADSYGVRVKSYSFKRRPVFTGVRELTVPAEMFRRLFNDMPVTEEEFYEFMPNELPLAANEYIIMTPENNNYPRSFFATEENYRSIARFHKENGMLCPLRFVKHEGKEPINLGIATYYDALNDDSIRVINVTGPAGTGKTYNVVQHAIHAMRSGKYVQTVVVSTLPAKNPLGALPGGEDQKEAPLVAAIKSAISSYLASTPEFKRRREILRKHGDQDLDDDESPEEEGTYEGKPKDNFSNNSRSDTRSTLGSFTGSFDDLDFMGDYSPEDFGEQHSRKSNKKSKKKKRNGGQNSHKGSNTSKMTYVEFLKKQTDYIFYRYFKCEVYEQIQGINLKDSIVIIDEAQRLKVDDADTVFARPAEGSKMVLCGDINQIRDSTAEKQFQNAISYSRELYYDWEGCANVALTENTRGDIARVMTENRRDVRRRMGLM